MLAVLRLVAVPFAALQIWTYYLPYPADQQRIAWVAVMVLAIGTPTVWWGARRAVDVRSAQAWAVAGLALDTVVALTLVVGYSFDPNTAVWAMLYIIPLEGAVLFQRRGALLTLGAISLGYVGREVYGDLALGVPFLLQSVTFRLGLAAIMAVVMGWSAQRLLHDRDRVRTMARAMDRHSAELTNANSALTAARRAQWEFVAVTNHELRTPLTAIQGFARTLKLRWTEMDEQSRRAAVDAIDQQSRRLGELVEDVLTVSSMRAGGLALSPRPLPLCAWLDEAVTVADIPVTVTCPEDVLVVTDSTRLLQILVNLLTNARKHGAAPYELTVHQSQDRVTIALRDHGPGVPEDFQPRMFEEFTQASVGASRIADGYGLGLAIVRYLTGALGGSISYRTASDGGAVFEIVLPTNSTPQEDTQIVIDDVATGVT